MGHESLWGWFSVGVIASLAGAAVTTVAITADSAGWVLLIGVLLSVLAAIVLMVTTIALGVQLGMARYDFLRARKR